MNSLHVTAQSSLITQAGKDQAKTKLQCPVANASAFASLFNSSMQFYALADRMRRLHSSEAEFDSNP